MRWTFAAAVVVSLMAYAIPAPAEESTTLALEAGFLMGHAQRCGVSKDRVERVSKGIRSAILAAAEDADQEKTAGARYLLIFRASAYPDSDPRVLLPVCTRIVHQFERLERHRLPRVSG